MIITIPIQSVSGAYIRWYFNGWHYWMFSRKYEITDSVQTRGIMITERFSQVSRIEEPTSKIAKKFIDVGDQSLTEANYEAIKNILQSEHAQIYISGYWLELEINRGSFTVRQNQMNAFDVIFRAEIKDASTVESRLIDISDEDPPEDIPEITLVTTTGTAGTFSITGTGGESITDFGQVTEHGMEYRITGGSWSKKIVGSSLGSNSFTTSLSGLASSTLYTYRAYVKVGVYTFYGAEKTLTTLQSTASLYFKDFQDTFNPMLSEVNDRYATIAIDTLPNDSTYVTLQLDIYYTGTGLDAVVYYRKNNLAWTQATTTLIPGVIENISIPFTAPFTKQDKVYLRLRLFEPDGSGSGTLTATITGGTVVEGDAQLIVTAPDEFTITYP